MMPSRERPARLVMTSAGFGTINLYEHSRFNECRDQAIAQLVQCYASDSTKYGDHLVSILIHGIRGSLNVINITAYALLKGSSVTEAQTNDISRILRGIQGIDRLINDMAVIIHRNVGSPLRLQKQTPISE